MKYIFSLLMMFIAYNGFSQNGEKRNRRSITTFPNGDEAITIIENSETNVIRLTSTDAYNKYEMLDLSNHEVVHRSSKKREIIRTELTVKHDENYTVGDSNTETKDENGDGTENSSGV